MLDELFFTWRMALGLAEKAKPDGGGGHLKKTPNPKKEGHTWHARKPAGARNAVTSAAASA